MSSFYNSKYIAYSVSVPDGTNGVDIDEALLESLGGDTLEYQYYLATVSVYATTADAAGGIYERHGNASILRTYIDVEDHLFVSYVNPYTPGIEISGAYPLYTSCAATPSGGQLEFGMLFVGVPREWQDRDMPKLSPIKYVAKNMEALK